MGTQDHRPDGGTAPGEGSSSATSTPDEGTLRGRRVANTDHTDIGVTDVHPNTPKAPAAADAPRGEDEIDESDIGVDSGTGA